jgi:hypothetical protein
VKTKKVVLVLSVLLTSAAALSLILATSRYIGILRHPEALQRGSVFKVERGATEVEGLKVSVTPVTGGTQGVSPLLVSTFWLFEVAVENGASRPVDVNFDRITLKLGEQEVRSLPTEAVLRLFNERMTGAVVSGAGRRGSQEVLDQLQNRKLDEARVFPGYARRSLVFFQPHPDVPDAAELKVYGLRWADGDVVAPLVYRLKAVR